jgi:hypothetical protein
MNPGVTMFFTNKTPKEVAKSKQKNQTKKVVLRQTNCEMFFVFLSASVLALLIAL